MTTRDKHLLHVYGVERTYEVEGLNHKDALELFSWNAFKRKDVIPSYMDISKRAILYSNGLPLSLEIIGSNLFSKTVLQWKSALDTYESIPDEYILEVLRVSYDGLKEIEKEIFLDIACFFKGYELSDVRSILLNGRGFLPEYGIQLLIDKCLIKIGQCCCVRMHDLIEDMGRQIVRQESPLKPGERSRLWFSKDILHVLKENKGTDKTEIIMLHLLKDKEVEWDGNALKKMENLKVLIIKNARFSRGPSHLPKRLRVLIWWRYPEPSLPDNFDPKKLAILDLSMSFLTLDNQLIMKFKSLKEMKLSGCQLLRQVPDLSGAPNLKELHIDYCENLVEVHDSVGFLDKLEHLNADGCTSLRILPTGINLTSLKRLSLRQCVSLKSFPEIMGMMENIRYVDLSGSAIRELPFSIGKLVGLESLCLEECYGLYELPISVFMLPKLKTLRADKCEGFEQFRKGKGQEQQTMNSSVSSNVRDARFGSCSLTDEFLATFLPYFHNVTSLFLNYSKITILSACINECHFLCRLVFDECMQLREISGVPPNIKYLSALNCTSLTSESRRILLNQTVHETGDTDFCLPGSGIPKWFNHHGRKPSLSFWFRNKFPTFALCVVGTKNRRESPTFHMLINGVKLFPCHYNIAKSKLATDHIFLFHLPHKFDMEKVERVCIKDEWNRVKISYVEKYQDDLFRESIPRKRFIKRMGIHVFQACQQKSSMEGIQFTNPKLQDIEGSETMDAESSNTESVSDDLRKAICNIEAGQKN